MDVKTLEVFPLIKELITKICAIDSFDVTAFATCIKQSTELYDDQRVLKQACNKLLNVLQIIVSDIKLDPSDSSTGDDDDIHVWSSAPQVKESTVTGLSTTTSDKDEGVSNSEQCPAKTTALDASVRCDRKGTDGIHKSYSSTTLAKSVQQGHMIDPQLVFLARNKHEIDERIAKYIETKQNDNNKINIHEFCGLQPGDSDVTESCARTAAVFQPRSGHSHLIVQKVVNRCGPQVKIKTARKLTLPAETETQRHIKSEPLKLGHSESVLPPSVEERLTNMEKHVKLYNGKPVPSDVYQRLQQLENRITYLESVSPEYCDNFSSVENESRKRQKIEHHDVSSDDIHMYKNLSPSEVDRQILQLKQRLSRRARELQTLGLQTK